MVWRETGAVRNARPSRGQAAAHLTEDAVEIREPCGTESLPLLPAKVLEIREFLSPDIHVNLYSPKWNHLCPSLKQLTRRCLPKGYQPLFLCKMVCCRISLPATLSRKRPKSWFGRNLHEHYCSNIAFRHRICSLTFL